MSTTTQYTLFDIPSKHTPPFCWSPNTWKARGVLNLKGVPYETEWVEYPDIRVRLAEFGIPSKGGLMPYTLPMMRVTITPNDGSDPQIKYITDSADIAKYINDAHPSPPMDYDNPINDEYIKFWESSLLNAFCGLVLCEVADECLPPRSAEYFHETRPKWMMMPVAEFKQKKIDEGAWEELEKGMKGLRELLKRNGGPFLAGEALSYGDIKLLGHMKWAQYGGRKDVYEKIRGWGGEELDRFLKAIDEKGITSRETS